MTFIRTKNRYREVINVKILKKKVTDTTSNIQIVSLSFFYHKSKFHNRKILTVTISLSIGMIVQ